MILANNETGAVFDALPAFAATARAAGALVHTDAVQAAGKIPVDVRALGVDFLALAAHKFGGPKGAGALWVRPGVRVCAARRRRRAGAGTPRRHGERRGARRTRRGVPPRPRALAAEGARLAALRDRLEAGLLAAVPGARVNAAGGSRLPTAASVAFPGAEAETLVAALDLEGIAVSAGLGLPRRDDGAEPRARSPSVSRRPTRRRRSGSPSGTRRRRSDVERLLEAVPRVVARARRATRT